MSHAHFMHSRRVSGFLAAATFVVALSACASGGSATRVASPSRQRNLITRSELAEVAANNAFDAIRTLRPEYLRNESRPDLGAPGSTITNPHSRTPDVYLDERNYGPDLTVLSSISVQSISEIRHLSASEAQSKWGVGHLGGVIQIITIKNNR
jgi:hypothetical protein